MVLAPYQEASATLLTTVIGLRELVEQERPLPDAGNIANIVVRRCQQLARRTTTEGQSMRIVAKDVDLDAAWVGALLVGLTGRVCDANVAKPDHDRWWRLGKGVSGPLGTIRLNSADEFDALATFASHLDASAA